MANPGTDALIRMAQEIGAFRADLEQRQIHLREMEDDFEVAARQQFSGQPVASLPDGVRAEPWKDTGLSLKERVRRYFEAHPGKEVSAPMLIEAGIETSVETLHSTLYKLKKDGEIDRLREGFYELVKPDQEEAPRKGGFHPGKGPHDSANAQEHVS